MKVVNNLFKLTLSGLLLSVLCACGGGSPTFDKPSDSSTGPTPIPSSSSVASSSKAPVTSEASTSSSSQATVVSSSSSLSSSSSSVDAGPTGASIYVAQCADCHGAKGQGGLVSIKLNSATACTTCGDYSAMVKRIDETMPPSNTAACDLTCAQKVATYIRSEFYKGSSSSSSVVVVTSSTPSSSSTAATSVPSSKSSSSVAATSSSSKSSSSVAATSSSVTPVVSSSSKSSSSSITTTSSSSTKNSSSSVVSSSSNVSTSSVKSTSSAGFVGDATRGKTLYENATNNCATCHGADGKLTTFKAIDPTKIVINSLSLAEYINASMPYAKGTDSTVCKGQCGYDIAAYIATWAAATSSVSSVASTSSSSVAVTSSSSKSSSSVVVVVSSSSSKVSSSSSVSSAVISSSSSSPKSSSSSSSIDSSAIFFQEDFESTALNAQPANWNNLIAYNYNASNTTSGSNYALVDNTKAHTGTKSIHFKGNFAQIVRALPANTQRVHMRAWVNTDRQFGNIPGGDTESNHSHIMGIKKTLDANNEVRVGEIKGALGTNDVPTDDISPLADKWRQGPQISANTWACVEVAMYADTSYDELRFWVDGTLVHSITSAADWKNSPANMGANWMSDKFNYVEFGFQSFTGSQTANVWMDDIVVSSKPIGCGTTSSSSSSISSSSSSSSNSSSSSGVLVGNVASGGTIYTTQCLSCHGSNGKTPSQPIDATKATYNNLSLEAYIAANMPFLASTKCTGQCAADTAAYIRSWVSSSSSSSNSSGTTSSSSSSSSSVSTSGINYGPRTLRVLTRNEFVNSVNDLTAVDIKTLDATSFDTVPSDGIVGGFSNNTMTGVNSSMLQSYSLVVGKVVDKLATQNFSSIVDCTGITSEACGSKLMSEFAPKVFRRPVTDAEISVYATMFTAEYTGGDTKEGIKLALKTMLTSPQFLYRDETGVSAAEIANGSSEPQYEATGTVQTMFSGLPKDPGYYAGENINFVTGINMIEITARALVGSTGSYPALKMSANGVNKEIPMTGTFNKVYRVVLPAGTVSGGQHLQFSTANGNGQIMMDLVKVSGAKKVEIFSPVVMDSDSYMLDQYQLASFLSFTFTGSTPDNTLLTAAAAGQLQTSAQVSAQVERLIATAKAKAHFGNFAAQWLRTDRVLDVIKDTTLYPKFTADVRKAMAQEVRDYYTHVVLDEGDAFTKLFDGNFTFVNAALADFYGITGVTGTNMRKVTTSARTGLVTAGAYLASNDHNLETAPILRAVNLRRQFLCHDVPPPPTGVSLNGESVDALREKARVDWEAYLEAHNNKATSRLKYEFQTSATLCQTCHKDMINPLGGGMEDFDAVGLPQSVDYNQLQVNAIGSLIGVTSISDGQRIDFTGAKQLAQSIATLDVTRQCFIDNNFRLALGTSATYFDHEKKNIPLSAAEKASYTSEEKKLEDVMKANNNSTKALLKAIGSMDSVRYRKNVQR